MLASKTLYVLSCRPCRFRNSNNHIQAPSHSIDPKLTEYQVSAPHLHHVQPVPLTTPLNNGTNSHTSSNQDRAPAIVPFTNARRRDYTKEEKEAFEQWITSNPNPNRAQRVQYAQKNGLEKSQVDNLINNRRRDLRKADGGVETVASTINSDGSAMPRAQRLGDDGPSHLESSTPEHGMDMEGNYLVISYFSILACAKTRVARVIRMFGSTITSPLDDTIILPVSEENVKRNLNAKSSYSSLDEYLRSPEETAPIETIQRAIGKAASTALAMMPKKTLTEDMLGPERKASCCLCTHPIPLGNEVVVFPCLRWFHEACIASYRNFWTSKDECPVCCQSIHGNSQDLCPEFAPLPSILNPRVDAETFTEGFDSQITNSKARRYSSAQNLRPRNSNASSAHGSGASSVASGTSAHSYGSSASRIRVKKLRREKQLGYMCSFCDTHFIKSQHMVAHEIKEHCLPQTFPCTFCHERFGSPESWRLHEIEEHCEPQLTWFCMLDGDFSTEKCLFCEYILPDDNHYENVHSLSPCNKPLVDRTFTTKQYLMGHLIEVHGMTEGEVMQFADEFILFWGLVLNIKHRGSEGVWRCGYCGIIDADWDERVQHIIDHWTQGGPRFTKSHRWRVERAKLDEADYEYIRHLTTGRSRHMRPHNMHFRGYEIYEAAMRHRASRLADQIRTSVDRMDLSDIPPTPKPNSPPTSSFLGSLFTSLADRRKAWFGFAKGKRKQTKTMGRN